MLDVLPYTGERFRWNMVVCGRVYLGGGLGMGGYSGYVFATCILCMNNVKKINKPVPF